MLTAVISRTVRQSVPTIQLGLKHNNGLISCWQQQQFRTAKTFRLLAGYGLPPLFNDDLLLKAQESDHFKNLEYEKVRFALISEVDSVFYDAELERFVSYVMRGGKRHLAKQLMDDTFCEIKAIQLRKLRKKEARMAKDGATKSADGKPQLTVSEINAGDEEIIELNPLTILKQAISNAEPAVITVPIKRGGASYQVPHPINAAQAKVQAIRWIIDAVKERPKPREKHFPEVMARELIDASLNRGKVIKRRDDMHRLADANKAYAHYRWG